MFYQVMVNHVELTPKQVEELKAFCPKIHKASQDLIECQNNLRSLRDEVRQVLNERHKVIDQISNFIPIDKVLMLCFIVLLDVVVCCFITVVRVESRCLAHLKTQEKRLRFDSPTGEVPSHVD